MRLIKKKKKKGKNKTKTKTLNKQTSNIKYQTSNQQTINQLAKP